MVYKPIWNSRKYHGENILKSIKNNGLFENKSFYHENTVQNR